MLAGLFLLMFGLGAATAAHALDVAAGVAFPRGFYEHALGVRGEFVSRVDFLPAYLSPVVRLSGYGATRDGVSLVVGSASPLLKAVAPGTASTALGFTPYIALGPSFSYLYSWADLEDFGTESNSDFSATLSIFVGVEFFSNSKISIFGEARQTIPSEFTFDYVMVGLKFRGSRLPGIG